MKQLLEALKPLLNTRPMFGVFALGDGSGRWFCAACGRKSADREINHEASCAERAHWRAIEALRGALEDVED